MDILSIGCFKAILDKYADPIINKITQISQNEWEKFKVDFDIAFRGYLKNSYAKYSKIKTLLYRTEPKYIYDFFEIPYLEKEHSKYIKAKDIDNILDISNYVIIQGTGGIGKSTLMKHLFINELEKKDLIPVFLELKDINDLEADYEISDIILEKLDNLGSQLQKKYLQYALKSGCFLFLLDGYDEIVSHKRDYFFRRFETFCDKYSKNYFIISSRPYSEFIEFQRFTVIKTCPLNKEQAMSLVGKLEFDKDIKQRFVNALDLELYEKHKSFASNPLLLNIMLLTYDNYAEIPEKLHLFYANAFETLYSKHDATKAGYRRELKSKLSYDSFKKIFSYFCFISYVQAKVEFSSDDLRTILKKVSINKVTFEIDNYIYDLVNSLCVLYKEGLNYKFAHRSFQEYFTALFLKELPDESMKQMGIQLIHKDIFKVTNDNVFDMLFDMAEERVEQNVFLPILQEFEQNIDDNKKYEFYFIRTIKEIKFDKRLVNQIFEIRLWLSRDVSNDIIDFIYKFANYYLEATKSKKKKWKAEADKLLEYLINNKGYKIGEYVSQQEMIDDEKMYELVKETWIGEVVIIMSNLSKALTEKQKRTEIDLSNLLLT